MVFLANMLSGLIAYPFVFKFSAALQRARWMLVLTVGVLLVGFLVAGGKAVAAGDCVWHDELGEVTERRSPTSGLEEGDCLRPVNGENRLVDFWRFSLTERLSLRIEMSEHNELGAPNAWLDGRGLSPLVRLTSADWQVLAEGQQIDIVLEAGQYYLWVTTTDSRSWRVWLPGDKCCGHGYDYRLTLSPSAAPPPPRVAPPPAQSCGADSLGWITDGVYRRTGNWTDGDCVSQVHELWSDAYEFYLVESRWVWMHLKADAAADPYLILSTVAGVQLEVDDNDGTDDDAYIGLELSSGLYRIEATKRRSGEDSYQLTLSSTYLGARSSVPKSDCFATTHLGERPAGGWQSGELSWGDCAVSVNGRGSWADMYTFSLSEPAYVSVQMVNRENVDPHVFLEADDGRRIATGYRLDGYVGVSAWLQAGNYRVWATKHDRPAGSYWLRVTAN